MSRILAICLIALMVSVLPASAHDFWMIPQGDTVRIVHGHGTDFETFDPSVVREVAAVDADSHPVAARLDPKATDVRVNVGRGACVISAQLDNGSWVKTVDGWKKGTRRAVPDAIDSSHSMCFLKAWVAPGAAALRPRGLALEIVPGSEPRVGAILTVQVLLRGRPLAGASLAGGQHGAVVRTDALGKASIRIEKAGQCVLTVHHKIKLSDQADVDHESLGATLTFVAK